MSAALPAAFDDSGHGSHEKKMMSISLTMLCVSIAKTVARLAAARGASESRS